MHFFYSQTHPAASGSGLIDDFKFINDFGFEAYKDIRQKPLELHFNEGIEICYVVKGRYEWIVEGKRYILLPGDGFVTCPWEKHGSPREVVDLGELYWVVFKPGIFEKGGNFFAGTWSGLSKTENRKIGEVLAANKNHKLAKANFLKKLFLDLRSELENREFGYSRQVVGITEEFFIQVVRHIQNRDKQIRKTQSRFQEFDRMLRDNLSKKWTLEEMSAICSLGTTSLTHFVKENTGYTPANYLIFLRLEKARGMLRNSDHKLTAIALECGFYSSQHFSSTFSKWIGSSPFAYRKLFKSSS